MATKLIDFARIVGCSKQHVSDLLKEGMPDPRKFDLAEVVKWLETNKPNFGNRTHRKPIGHNSPARRSPPLESARGRAPDSGGGGDALPPLPPVDFSNTPEGQLSRTCYAEMAAFRVMMDAGSNAKESPAAYNMGIKNYNVAVANRIAAEISLEKRRKESSQLVDFREFKDLMDLILTPIDNALTNLQNLAAACNEKEPETARLALDAHAKDIRLTVDKAIETLSKRLLALAERHRAAS